MSRSKLLETNLQICAKHIIPTMIVIGRTLRLKSGLNSKPDTTNIWRHFFIYHCYRLNIIYKWTQKVILWRTSKKLRVCGINKGIMACCHQLSKPSYPNPNQRLIIPISCLALALGACFVTIFFHLVRIFFFASDSHGEPLYFWQNTYRFKTIWIFITEPCQHCMHLKCTYKLF